MSGTYTNTRTNTYTESRARYVLGKMRDDFIALKAREFPGLSTASIDKWWRDISYVMYAKALKKVELQFRLPEGKEWAITYSIVSDGNIYRDDKSGRNDFWNLPDGIQVSIVISRDHENINVSEYLEKQGWTSGGTYVQGNESDHGGYSKNEFGVNITRTGDW